MSEIRDIAQLDVALPDRAAWEAFAAAVLGFPTRRSSDGSLTYLRFDARASVMPRRCRNGRHGSSRREWRRGPSTRENAAAVT